MTIEKGLDVQKWEKLGVIICIPALPTDPEGGKSADLRIHSPAIDIYKWFDQFMRMKSLT